MHRVLQALACSQTFLAGTAQSHPCSPSAGSFFNIYSARIMMFPAESHISDAGNAVRQTQFQFYSVYWKWRFRFSWNTFKCHRCKKSSEDELKSIKTKNSSGAVSYENIRIFNGSLHWHAAALIWAAEVCRLSWVKLMVSTLYWFERVL